MSPEQISIIEQDQSGAWCCQLHWGSNTVKLARHVSYMDNLQGLYQLCRNTGINYSNLDCQF